MPNTPPTALQRVPPHIVSLADHERHAQQHLNANAWAYFAGGAADEITLVEIVEAMEGPLAMTECSQHDSQCGIAKQCGVRANWRLINDVVADALRGVTLAQMLKPPSSTDDAKRRPIALHVASS